MARNLGVLFQNDFKLAQQGNASMHNHTLDFVITRKDINLVSEISTNRHLPSDDYAVACNITRQSASKWIFIFSDIQKIYPSVSGLYPFAFC